MRFNSVYIDTTYDNMQIAEEFFSRLSLLSELSIHQMNREAGNKDFLIKFKNNKSASEINNRYGKSFTSDTAFNFVKATDSLDSDSLAMFITAPVVYADGKYSGQKNLPPKKVSADAIVKFYFAKGFDSIIIKDTDTDDKYQIIFPKGTAAETDRHLEAFFTTHSATKMAAKRDVEKSLDVMANNYDWTSKSIESVQPFGLFVDCDSILKKFSVLEESTEFLAMFETPLEYSKFKTAVDPILSNSFDQDFSSELMSMKRLFTKFSYADWLKFVTIASGASRFKKEFLDQHFGQINLIHSRISEYRNVEKKFGAKGDKDNTADIVIHSFDNGSEFLKALSEYGTSIKDGVIHIKNGDTVVGKFVQVSLKGNEGDPLGRVTSTIKALYGMKSSKEAIKDLQDSVQYSKIISESFIGDIASKFKVAVKSIQSMGAAIFNKILAYVSAAKSWIKSFVKDVQSHYKKNYSSYGSELFSFKTEAADEFETEIENVLELDKAGQMKFWSKCLKKIKENFASAKIRTPFAYLEFDDTVTEKSMLSKELIVLLIGNYVFSKTISEILSKSSEPTELSNQLIDIVSEMVFGKTDFPLFILYSGKSGEGKSWKYIGTKSEFSEKRKDIIKRALNSGDFSLPLISVKANQSEKNPGTYVYYMYTLSDITMEDGEINIMYMEYRIGTAKNQLLISGQTEVPYSSVPMAES